MESKNTQFTISTDSSHLTMRGSSRAEIKSSITIVGSGTKLPISIIGEFKDIPVNLHGIYLQAMNSSYGDTNVYNNTDEEPKKIKEQKSEWRLNKISKLLLKAIGK